MLDTEEHKVSLSPYQLVDKPLYCVLTRIRLRHFWALPLAIWMYLRVRRQAHRVSQLKQSCLLIENLHTFLILSVWDGEAGFRDFGTWVTSHVAAAHWTFSNVNVRNGKYEVWSTQWRLWAISNNLSWDDFEVWSGLNGGQAVVPDES